MKYTVKIFNKLISAGRDNKNIHISIVTSEPYCAESAVKHQSSSTNYSQH